MQEKWRASLFGMVATGIITYILLAIFFHNIVLVYAQDAEDILAPLFFNISRSIHQYGLWAGMYDPGQVAGLSLWNTPYFHPLYPLYFNWLGTDATIFDTLARLRLINLIHLSLYASGSYFLCRTIGVNQWLSLAVGISAPWFPAVHSLLNWPQILASFSWIPWIIACQLLLYRNPSPSVRNSAILGLAVTFSLLVYAQPAQNMVLAIVGSAIVWISTAISVARRGEQEEKKNFIRSTCSLAIAGGLALLLCGKYLFSVAAYMSKAVRWLGGHGIVIGHQRMPLSAFREHALHWGDMVALVNYRPEHTIVIGNLYLGAPLLLCALLLHKTGRNNTAVLALLYSALITVLCCFAIFAPILQWIPIANKVRELNWWSCYAVAVMLPLGAIGLQQLLQSADTGGAALTPKSRLSAILLIGLLAAIPLFVLDKASLYQSGIACLSFVILLVFLAWHQPRRWIAPCVGSAVIILSAGAPVFAYPRFPTTMSLLKQPDHVLIRREAREVADRITDPDDYRFAVSTDIPKFKNFTTTLATLGLRGIRGDISPQEYDKFRLLFFPKPELANLYGVKYEIVPNKESQPSDVAIDKEVSLRVNSRALPRVFFVQGGIKVVDSPVDCLLTGDSPGVLRFFVASSDLPDHLDWSPYSAGDPDITFADLAKNTPVDIRGSFRAKGPGLLVLNEDPAGRWQGTLDGRSIQPIRVNGFQTAFPVATSGMHEVEIRRPSRVFE